MAIDIGIFAIIVLAIILLVIVIAFVCYLFRHACQKKVKPARRADSESPRRHGLSDGVGDRSYKTTTDDDTTIKLHTFDQILKVEEKSSYGKSLNVLPLKFPQVNQSAAPNGNTDTPT